MENSFDVILKRVVIVVVMSLMALVTTACYVHLTV